MHDDELREAFAAWAGPLTATPPPPAPAIRRRARLRTARITLSCVTALAVLGAGAFSASRVLGAGHPFQPAPAGSPTPNGRSQHAGHAGPNPGYARARYYVAVGSDQEVAGVYDAVTGRRIATLTAPVEGPPGHRYPTFFTDITAAGDDRTFVLAAIANVSDVKARPVWLFRLHLAKHGYPGRLVALRFSREQQGVVGHWYQGIASIALSPDGSRLAIATNRSHGDTNGPPDIEVVTLASAATRTWTATPQDIGSLSWAGDRTVAYGCTGVCLLDTRAPGSRLATAKPLIPWSRTYRGLQGFQWPMITPDGADIYVAMDGGGLAIVEFSAHTGRPLRVVLGPRPTGGAFCGILRSDESGQHLVATCAWGQVTGTVSDGRFRWGHNLPPAGLADNGSGSGGYVIGW